MSRVGRTGRAAIALGTALLVGGCPQESREATIAFEADGRPVFDGVRGDCLIRLSVDEVRPSGERTSHWAAEAPMPVSNTGPCALEFPVRYGQTPSARVAHPAAAPPLRPATRYIFSADGMNHRYESEFQLP